MKYLAYLCQVAVAVVAQNPLMAFAEEPVATDPARQEAKALFEEAQIHYTKDQFEEAAAKFLDAFAKKPFSSFVFNAAVAFEKANKLDRALEQFQRYLELEPQASDAKEVKARIESLKGILTPPAPTATPAPGQAPPEKAPAPMLPAFETKGLVIIDTKPQRATIYLDDKAKGVFATSPWQGSLPPKPVKVLIEARGFKPEERQIFPRVDKVLELYVALSEQHFLGWVEVISNVPGAEVYIDRRESGAIGRTPYTGHLKPGKHTIWIQKSGYESASREITVEPGTATTHTMNLEVVGFGILRAGSKASEGATLFVDEVQTCAMPCEHKLTPGEHKIRVEKEDMEDFEGSVKVERADEIAMDVAYSPKPSRAKAWTQAVVSAAFLGGGIYLGQQGKKIKEEIEKDAVDPTQFISTDDSRKTRGKIYYIAADVCFGVSVVSGLLSLWHFLESGPPSTAAWKTTNNSKPAQPRMSWVPVALPGGMGLVAKGGF